MSDVDLICFVTFDCEFGFICYFMFDVCCRFVVLFSDWSGDYDVDCIAYYGFMFFDFVCVVLVITLWICFLSYVGLLLLDLLQVSVGFLCNFGFDLGLWLMRSFVFWFVYIVLFCLFS